MEQTPSCITVYGGEYFDLLAPEKSDFDIEVIAHSLSRINRFTGHIVPENYSVAEHCVHVSNAVPEKYAFIGLMHDASEAFCGDVSSPLKKELDRYKEIENRVQEEMARYYGYEYPFPKEIHEADKRVYWAERRTVAPGRDGLWHQELRASRKVTPVGWRPNKAKKMFLKRFYELTDG